MQDNDLVRKTLVSRIKSEQAIRRSRLLVKGTQKLVERARTPHEGSSKASAPIAIGTFLSMRDKARKARLESKQAIEKSRAARQRKSA